MINVIAIRKKNDFVDYLIFSSLWLIIILPKVIQLLFYGIIGFVLLARMNFKIRIGKTTNAIFLLCGIHLWAIIYNILINGGEITRIFASINTLALWVLAIIFYWYFQNKEVDLHKIGRYCCINIVILFIGACVTIYCFYFLHIDTVRFLGKTLYETTYLSGEAKTKFIGLNDFSNMNLFYVMSMLMMSFYYLKRKSMWLQLIIILMTSIEVMLINSRSGYVLYGIVLIVYCIYLGRMIQKKQMLICVTLIAFLVCIILFKNISRLFMERIIYGNASSTSFRVVILKESINAVMQRSPLWGIGIKETMQAGYVLGSHSTYIGFLYKTGIVGLVIGMYIMLTTIYVAMKNTKNMVITTSTICFLILFAIEDLDGTNWSILLFFSMFAILSNKKSLETVKI